MAIQYIYPTTGEIVKKEPWRWVALYKDGTTLQQFDVTGAGAVFHRFGEIDTANVDEFQLVHDSFQPIVFKIPDGATLVHFYRNRETHEMLTDEAGEHLQRIWKTKIWVIGFRLGKTYFLAYADEAGHVLLSNDQETFLNKALPVGVN